MTAFIEQEKERLIPFVQTSAYFSEGARGGGSYKGHDYPFCLPVEQAEENLFSEIRQPALDFFARKEIQWHDGRDGKPSNHLCSSQVCCANFLYPFAHQPQALATLLRPVFPTLAEMLPVEGQYVSFEWIGEKDYLNEAKSLDAIRRRGAHYTSADAAVKFRHTDGRVQFVLIEWKYTESYAGGTSKAEGASGQTRLGRYGPIYAAEDCPLDKELMQEHQLDFKDLFYEPFYQLMRQQFLAHGMEKAHEEGASIVSVLHLAPRRNEEFKTVTSPALKALGDEATTIWKRLVATPGRFASVYIEDLFAGFEVKKFPKFKNWRATIAARYEWVYR